MKAPLLIATILGVSLMAAIICADDVEAAPKYDVVHVTGAIAPVDCPPVFEGTLPAYGVRDCNVADGTIVVRNKKPGPTKFSVDTAVSWPEY